jgi:tetratricopeptide (TPR) repeat protein
MVNGSILAISLIAGGILLYSLNGTAFAASSDAWDGHEHLQLLGDPAGGIASLEKGATTANVYQWDFVRDYANTVAQAYFYNKAGVPQAAVQAAIAAMEQVTAGHPNDAYNHYLLADLYNLGYDIDPKNYLAKAEVQEQAALQLSPSRQEIYYYMSKTKNLENDDEGALVMAKKALDLDPKVPDSHFYYGMLAFALGQKDTGYNEVKTAMALGRQWHDFYEARVSGDYFADAGHLAEAIDLYKAALKLQPTDMESEAKLGAAFYIAGNIDLARKYLSDAASTFNFSQSAAYTEYQPILDALGIRSHP